MINREELHSKQSVMTNVGRRELFVQFQTKNPIIRDHNEREDNLDDRGSGPEVTAGRVRDEIKNSKRSP